MFTKYSAAIIPLLLLICGCNDNEQLQERHLAVTSMDIDDPDGEPLKKWVGKYNGRYDPDLNAITELDSNSGREVLVSHEKQNLVSVELEHSRRESVCNSWR